MTDFAQPRLRTKLGERALIFPRWKSLLVSCQETNTAKVDHLLKSHLFPLAYNFSCISFYRFDILFIYIYYIFTNAPTFYVYYRRTKIFLFMYTRTSSGFAFEIE
jgi:hypothetical protein